MSDGGKGSSPRPFSISLEEFGNNHERIFGKKESKMQVKVQEDLPVGACGCGRSPTGNCCGWHALTEDEFKQALAEHHDKQNKGNQ